MAVVSMHNVTPGVSPQRQVGQVFITAAQMLALHSTNVEVIPDPGDGRVIIVEEVLAYKPAGTAYGSVGSGDDLEFRYHNNTGQEIMDIETTGFLNQATEQRRVGRPAVTDSAPWATREVIVRLGAAVTTGDTGLHLKVFYHVLELA